jgi:hypothetical protein
MNFWTLNEFPRVFKPKYVFWNWKGMNNNGPRFGLRPSRAGSAPRWIWPDRPMLVAGHGHRTAHTHGAARWRGHRRCTGDRGYVRSVEREPMSGGQSTGQGGGAVVRLTEAAWHQWGGGFGWQWWRSRWWWSFGWRCRPSRVLGAPMSQGRGEAKLKCKNSDPGLTLTRGAETIAAAQTPSWKRVLRWPEHIGGSQGDATEAAACLDVAGRVRRGR